MLFVLDNNSCQQLSLKKIRKKKSQIQEVIILGGNSIAQSRDPCKSSIDGVNSIVNLKQPASIMIVASYVFSS